MKNRNQVGFFFLAILPGLIISLFFSLNLGAKEPESVYSPDRQIHVSFSIENNQPLFAVSYKNQPVVDKSPLGIRLNEDWQGEFQIANVNTATVENSWKPLYGEWAVVPDNYNSLSIVLREQGALKRTWKIEFRAYNEGVAVRYVFPRQDADWTIQSEQTAFALPLDSESWPIYWTESTFPEQPISLSDAKGLIHPPLLTRSSCSGRPVVALLEANVVDYPRYKLKLVNDTIAVQLTGNAQFSTRDRDFKGPWRMIMIAENECRLVENEFFVFNLNNPRSSKDTNWIRPGKTISNEMNCSINTTQLKSMVDFASENNCKYIQIDWGWYGTEWSYTDAERDEWAKNNPDKAQDPTWKENTKADPTRVAVGLVPYFPSFKSSTRVDLDLPELIRYGKEKGVGICLYLNDRVIKTNDIDKLFTLYHQWGVAGLKPGFVAYGSQQSTAEIRYLIETAAKHKLWLCIHDAHLPMGESREFPNLMTCEGGGGQEGNHPEFHDVVQPFIRGLAGSFDYTPAFYVRNKSAAHQLSLLLTLYNPTPVIRKGWAIRNNQSGDAFGSEKEFFAKAQTTFTQTKVLDGKVGSHIVVARQTADGSWQLGATAGSKAYTSHAALSFLDPGREYKMTLWTDAPEAKDGWRGTVKMVKTVKSTDIIDLPMAAAGGAVALFE